MRPADAKPMEMETWIFADNNRSIKLSYGSSKDKWRRPGCTYACIGADRSPSFVLCFSLCMSHNAFRYFLPSQHYDGNFVLYSPLVCKLNFRSTCAYIFKPLRVFEYDGIVRQQNCCSPSDRLPVPRHFWFQCSNRVFVFVCCSHGMSISLYIAVWYDCWKPLNI